MRRCPYIGLPIILLAVATLASPAALWAQQGRNPGRNPRANPPPPPGARPSGSRGSDLRRPAELDNKSLPKGYQVPPEPPKSITTTATLNVDPWDGDRTKRNNAIRDFSQICSNGDLSKDEDKRLIEQVVEWYLAQMTLPKFRDKGIVPDSDRDTPSRMKKLTDKRTEDGKPIYRYLDVPELREQMLAWVRQSPAKPTGSRAARKYLMQMLTKHAPKLLEYHITARQNAAIMLASLSQIPIVEAEGLKPAERYLDARPALVKLVNDRQQDLPVRIWGVLGLSQIGSFPEARTSDKNEIVETFLRALAEGNNEHWWYPMRLVDGLGQVGIAYDQTKRPIVAQALAQVLVDKQRHRAVRTAAAQALGRLTYGGDVDLGLIAHEIAEMTRQLGDDFIKNPNRAEWTLNALRIYGAFKPLTEEEEKRGSGLITIVNKTSALAGHKKAVQDAFEAVKPVLQQMVKAGGQPSGDALIKLSEWLKNNPPKTNRIAESEPPIVSGPAVEPRTSSAGSSNSPS